MLQLAAAGRALAAMGPPGRLEDAYHMLAGLHALTAEPLPKPVTLALPTARLTAANAVRRVNPIPYIPIPSSIKAPAKAVSAGAAHSVLDRVNPVLTSVEAPAKAGSAGMGC